MTQRGDTHYMAPINRRRSVYACMKEIQAERVQPVSDGPSSPPRLLGLRRAGLPAAGTRAGDAAGGCSCQRMLYRPSAGQGAVTVPGKGATSSWCVGPWLCVWARRPQT